MKTLTFVTAIFLALPLGSALADEAKLMPNPVEACKSKTQFAYNFDMMNIERDQMDRTISHEQAREKKLERHEKLLEDLEDCDDLKDD